MFLSGIFETYVSRRQLCLFWPLHGPNPPKFHLYARESVTDRRVSSTCNHCGGDRTLKAAGL